MAVAFKHDIFISYKKADKVFVDTLMAALDAEGFRVWTDDRLNSGDRWFEKIKEELRDSRAIIGVWTKASVDSDGRFIPSEKDKYPYVEVEHELAGDRLVGLILDAPIAPRQYDRIEASDFKGWKPGNSEHKGWQKMLEHLRGLCTPAFLVTQITHLETDAARQKSKADETRRRVQALQKDLRAEQKRVAELEAQMLSVRFEGDVDLKVTREQNLALQAEIGVLTKQLGESAHLLTQTKSSLAASEGNNSESDKKINAKLQAIEKELLTTQDQLRDTENERARLSKGLDEARQSAEVLLSAQEAAAKAMAAERAQQDATLEKALTELSQTQSFEKANASVIAEASVQIKNLSEEAAKAKILRYELDLKEKRVDELSAKMLKLENGEEVSRAKSIAKLATSVAAVSILTALALAAGTFWQGRSSSTASIQPPKTIATKPLQIVQIPSEVNWPSKSLAQDARSAGVLGSWGLNGDCVSPYSLTIDEPDQLDFAATGERYKHWIRGVEAGVVTVLRKGEDGKPGLFEYFVDPDGKLEIKVSATRESFGIYTRCDSTNPEPEKK